jgi:hypothetical protein
MVFSSTARRGVRCRSRSRHCPERSGKLARKGCAGIRKELDRLRPQMAEKFGFATGLTIVLIGYLMQKRKERFDRLERKLDRVADEHADDN